jgi:imidazolonepropionase-like amidohydrolase
MLHIVLAMLLASAATAPASPGAPAPERVTVFEDVTVVSNKGDHVQAHMRVVVRGGFIESVGPLASAGSLPSDARVIPGSRRFLMPGLWDAHVHLIDAGAETLPLFLVHGITSVRDCGGPSDSLKAWRDQIATGVRIGPRIKFSGPMLEGRWDPAEHGGRSDHWGIPDADAARRAVDSLARDGVDFIKFRSYADSATYIALADAAHAHHLPLAGHAPWGLDPVVSAKAGQGSYEHAFYPWPWIDLPVARKREVEDAFRSHGSLIVPTLVAWETFRMPIDSIAARAHDTSGTSDARMRQVSPSLRRNWRTGLEEMRGQKPGTAGWNGALDALCQQVAEMHEGGVGVMAGTDLGCTLVLPGSSLQQELELLVRRCRFTPLDALLSATLIPAKFFGLESSLGAVEPGKDADLVLIEANPLDDIGNIQRIGGVMTHGRWFDAADLRTLERESEQRIARESTDQGR